MDVQVSREGTMPVATAALERPGMASFASLEMPSQLYWSTLKHNCIAKPDRDSEQLFGHLSRHAVDLKQAHTA